MTNDESPLAELAGQPLDESDAATLGEVRALLEQADPVPGDLTERIRFAVALDEVFDEVARLTRVPMDALAVRGEPAVVRTETLTFSADRLSAMVTVNRVGTGALRMDGWLTPPGACRVRLRLQVGGEHETLADEHGRFSFDGLHEDFGQLSFHPVNEGGASAGDLETTVVTPLFEL